MKETFSNDFKRFFLIKFTEELIRNSGEMDITKLQEIVELKEIKNIKPIPFKQEPIPKPSQMIKQVPVRPIKQPAKKIIRAREIPKRSLFIPEQPLPTHLQYLKPLPTPGIDIDLFKLNPLIKDPAVRIIEVNPDEKVVITGTIGTKLTNIVLNKEDINRVISKISEVSKIPVSEGIYKVVIGNMIVLAIISDVVGSRFIIKKMMRPPVPRKQYPAIPAKQPVFPTQRR